MRTILAVLAATVVAAVAVVAPAAAAPSASNGNIAQIASSSPQFSTLASLLKKAGVEVTYVPIKGAGHGGPGFNTPEVAKQIEEFFAKHLKKSPGK